MSERVPAVFRDPRWLRHADWKRKLRINTDCYQRLWRMAVADGRGIETATRRLSVALDSLEAALARRQEADGRHSALSAQMAALGADRSRLAAELDRQTARANRLEGANKEATQRIDRAMEAVRSVAGEQEP